MSISITRTVQWSFDGAVACVGLWLAHGLSSRADGVAGLFTDVGCMATPFTDAVLRFSLGPGPYLGAAVAILFLVLKNRFVGGAESRLAITGGVLLVLTVLAFLAAMSFIDPLLAFNH